MSSRPSIKSLLAACSLSLDLFKKIESVGPNVIHSLITRIFKVDNSEALHACGKFLNV